MRLMLERFSTSGLFWAWRRVVAPILLLLAAIMPFQYSLAADEDTAIVEGICPGSLYGIAHYEGTRYYADYGNTDLYFRARTYVVEFTDAQSDRYRFIDSFTNSSPVQFYDSSSVAYFDADTSCTVLVRTWLSARPRHDTLLEVCLPDANMEQIRDGFTTIQPGGTLFTLWLIGSHTGDDKTSRTGLLRIKSRYDYDTVAVLPFSQTIAYSPEGTELFLTVQGPGSLNYTAGVYDIEQGIFSTPLSMTESWAIKPSRLKRESLLYFLMDGNVWRQHGSGMIEMVTNCVLPACVVDYGLREKYVDCVVCYKDLVTGQCDSTKTVNFSISD